MNKEQLTITANYIKKYGDDHFDILKWFKLDADYLIRSGRVKVNNYDNPTSDEEQMPFRDVYDLDREFSIVAEDILDYDYSEELWEKYDQLLVQPFEILKESDISRCDTTACVAGWAVLAYNDMIINNSFNETIVNGFEEAAIDILEFEECEASNLFDCNKYSVWDLVADKYDLKEKAWELAEQNFKNSGMSSVYWTDEYEYTRNHYYFAALGSLITSKIAYEVLMDIVNDVIDISGAYACYKHNIN